MSSSIFITDRAPTGTTPKAALTLRAISSFILRYSVVFFLLLFGALKWTPAEAKAIQPMVSHSPVFFWLYPTFGVQHGSEVIGVVELVLALLIVLRRWSPRLSAIGSLAASGMFVVTLSFLITTPNIGDGAPFLLKDITLLGAALWSASEAMGQRSAREHGDA
jgi:reactive chlorine resistance protein C